MTGSHDTEPLDSLRGLIAAMPGPAQGAAAALRARLRPAGAGLGRLGKWAEWLALWSGKERPVITGPRLSLFAAGHGSAIHRPGTPAGAEIRARLERVAAGGEAVNGLCVAANTGLRVLDLAIDVPCPDIVARDAFSARELAATCAFGMEAAAGEVDLLCLSALDAPSHFAIDALGAALGAELPGEAPVIARAGATRDPLNLLAQLGARDVAAILGAILAARHQRVPVLVDGPAALAALLVLTRIDPHAAGHCQLVQAPTGRDMALAAAAGLTPMADLALPDGAGAGAVMGVHLLRAALAAVEAAEEGRGGLTPPPEGTLLV